MIQREMEIDLWVRARPEAEDQSLGYKLSLNSPENTGK